MALDNALLITQVAHARVRPKVNRFRYHVYYLCLPPSEWKLLGKLWLLSLDRFNLFSLHGQDYGRDGNPDAWMKQLLHERAITSADGDVVLMTMPRVLGYAFNPVSFWFCLDSAGQLRAVLADVSNTFGERHAYLIHHEDQRPIGKDDLFSSRKVFHVSPFIEVTGHYNFRFAYGEKAVGVWIDHHDDEGLLLTTSVTGKRSPATSLALFHCFLRYPLVTLKVIGLIHYQAIKLMLKGIRYHRKPLPPTIEIS